MARESTAILSPPTDGADVVPGSAEALPALIAELDRVTLSRAVESDDGDVVPAGATGTVVGIWAGGAAFEVEFVKPISALATVSADMIAARGPATEP